MALASPRLLTRSAHPRPQRAGAVLGDLTAPYARLAGVGAIARRDLALAELDAADLAGDGLGQLGDELDLARVLEGCGDRPAMLLQLADESVGAGVARRQDHERLDDLPALRVGLANDGGLGHGGVLDQRGFDLERSDPVGRRDDHVVGATHEPEIPVL